MLERGYSDQALTKQMNDGHHFLILSVNDKAVGFLSYSHQGENRYFLHKFYIDHRQHRKGLGRELFRYLLELLTDLKEIRLTVNRQNFKAINFYFRNGFIIEEVMDFDIGSGYFMNDFVMLFRRPAD